MLCPEVCDFKAPESIFTTQTSQISEGQHLTTINEFTYNHLVSVVLPDTSRIPESLSSALLKDCDYYKIDNLKPCELVYSDFTKNFAHKGKLYLLSINCRIDCDNCIAVTPTGQLILNLDKETYQSLGLEGKVSHFHAKSKERYTVTIDLQLPQLTPGKACYERTKKCLQEWSETFSVIVTWDPHNADTCPSSIAKYFYDLGYPTKLCQPNFDTHTLYTIKVPSTLPTNEEDSLDFIEWLGMVTVQGDTEEGNADNYVNTYDTPEPNSVQGQVKVLQWRGLFTAKEITSFFQKLCAFKEDSQDLFTMYVQGFSDSPVAWGTQPHHYYTNGDNGYFLLSQGKNVICCKQQCSQKRYKNKQKANS